MSGIWPEKMQTSLQDKSRDHERKSERSARELQWPSIDIDGSVCMEPESITKALWRQARAGDRAAFEQLFALHTSRLLLFVRAKLGVGLREKIEAEDVLQDAYVAALKTFAEFEYSDDGAFLRWMCRIVDHRLGDAHDYFSARKRQQMAIPRSAPTGPVTALGRAENQQQIEWALSKLSDEHRDVLLLRYFEGLSAEDTGQRMNRSPGAIRNLSARALAELGKHISSAQKAEP